MGSNGATHKEKGKEMEEMEMEKCSLCGNDTEFQQGGISARWYLCEDCEGTEEAEALCFFHEGD